MRTASVRLTLAALAVSLVLAPAAPAGQEFVHWLASAPTSLDPAKSGHIQDDQIMWLLYDALTQLSPDGKQMLPALAERWQASADGLTYTFSLRKNVHFHDGTLLDADAVRISYERQYLRGSPQYSPAPPNAYETVLSGFIKELRVLDRHRVAITTRYARPHQFALVKIVSPQALAGHAGDLSRTPVGTGPFQLERWEAGQVTLVPFARTWHGRARLHRVRFTATSNNDEAMERLGAGEIDLLHNVPPDFFEELRGNPRIALRKYGGLNTMFLGMQMDRPGLRDQRVREAIVRAVNRERMAAVLGRGAMVAATGPLPPACAGFDPAVAQPAYDPARARALLEDAGATRLTLRLLYYNPLEVWAEVVHGVQAELGKAGITVEPVRVPSWKEFHTERRKGAHDLYLYSWSVSTPDPDRFLGPLFDSRSNDNFGRFADPRVDRLLAEARQPLPDDRRLQLYGEAAGLVVERIPALFLVHRIGVAAVHSRVEGLTLSTYGFPHDKLVKVEVR